MAGPTQPAALPQFQFMSALTGGMEVPPTGSAGTGVALIGFDPALTTIRVALGVSNLRQATVAHIHVGRPGENGPIVLFLFGPTSPRDIGPFTILTNGTFTAANLTGPLQGMPLSVLAEQMMAGNTYVNVHTVAHPNGEIRGQVVRR